jgi:hypothetical protein
MLYVFSHNKRVWFSESPVPNLLGTRANVFRCRPWHQFVMIEIQENWLDRLRPTRHDVTTKDVLLQATLIWGRTWFLNLNDGLPCGVLSENKTNLEILRWILKDWCSLYTIILGTVRLATQIFDSYRLRVRFQPELGSNALALLQICNRRSLTDTDVVATSGRSAVDPVFLSARMRLWTFGTRIWSPEWLENVQIYSSFAQTLLNRWVPKRNPNKAESQIENNKQSQAVKSDKVRLP